MFEARRGGYKLAVYANFTDLTLAATSGALHAGDRIMYGLKLETQYGKVVTAGSITVTPQ